MTIIFIILFNLNKIMTKINDVWIKEALAKRYGRNWKENMDRELIIRKISDQGTSETDI